jgi:hypothetical protein
VESPKTLRQFISEQTPGDWIAISLERNYVVGLGASKEEAREKAEADGYYSLILLRVPQKSAARPNPFAERNAA